MREQATPIRIMCVDDNGLVAEALKRLVEQEPLMEWVGWVSDCSTLADRVREGSPSIILMDIDIPGVDTFALLERLGEDHPDIRVVMFSGHVQPTYIDRAMDGGAWGYLSKNDAPGVLLEGIRRVRDGRIAISDEAEIVRRGTPR